MFKKIFFLTALIGLCCACSDDDRATPDQSAHVNLIVKQTENIGVTTYTYDANNRIQKYSRVSPSGFAGNFFDFKFTYDPDGRLIQMDYINNQFGGPVPLKSVEKISYNNEEKVIKKRFYYIDSVTEEESLAMITDYEYSGNQVIAKEHDYSVNKYNLKTYSYAPSGNLIQMEVRNNTDQYYDGNITYIYVYTDYDTQKNPLVALPAAFLFPSTVINNYGAVTSGGNIITSYTYNYNADGYPVTSTDQNENVVTYEYKRL